MNTPSRNRTIAIILFVAPIVLIFTVLILFAVVNTVFGGLGPSTITQSGTQGNSRMLTLTIFNFALSFIGLIAVIALLVNIPLGIYFLTRKTTEIHSFDPRSGQGALSEVPKEIQGWNWGAAGFTWIWGVYNGVWISLLNLIPFVNLFFWIFLGLKGSEWAWRKTKWKSVEAFQLSQKKWRPWGIAFFILRWLLFLWPFLNGFIRTVSS